jgi:hypothetical protein
MSAGLDNDIAQGSGPDRSGHHGKSGVSGELSGSS